MFICMRSSKFGSYCFTRGLFISYFLFFSPPFCNISFSEHASTLPPVAGNTRRHSGTLWMILCVLPSALLHISVKRTQDSRNASDIVYHSHKYFLMLVLFFNFYAWSKIVLLCKVLSENLTSLLDTGFLLPYRCASCILSVVLDQNDGFHLELALREPTPCISRGVNCFETLQLFNIEGYFFLWFNHYIAASNHLLSNGECVHS